MYVNPFADVVGSSSLRAGRSQAVILYQVGTLELVGLSALPWYQQLWTLIRLALLMVPMTPQHSNDYLLIHYKLNWVQKRYNMAVRITMSCIGVCNWMNKGAKINANKRTF